MSNEKKTGSDNYEVGYGRPPKQTQFQKGRSGNPKGRSRKPKPSENLSEILNVALNENIKVRIDGKTQNLPVTHAIVKSLIMQAVQGKPTALRELVKLLKEYGGLQNPNDDNKQTGVLIAPAGMTPQEFAEAMKAKRAKQKKISEFSEDFLKDNDMDRMKKRLRDI